MDLLHLLSWACIVFTLGMFSTGLVDLKKMQKSKSTDNIQFLPFLTTCANNLGWFYYGMLKRDQTLIVVNLIGAFLQSIYILVYFKYTKQKKNVLFQVLVISTVVTSAGLYFSYLAPGDLVLNQLGLVCSMATVGVYLSPLVDLSETSPWLSSHSSPPHLHLPVIPSPFGPHPLGDARLTSYPKSALAFGSR
ncbi:sugar transporter SWEET1 isoform X2 [Syngnathus typhle]|uniref:sugar transporter SWEET1 isoform X2 n=1 Tax=Syngnathus typhle TaxID=161592 RepID=UPI002A698D94|nr:sugar transporter SWEET1 isoform X2 [Syngnathus typhle]